MGTGVDISCGGGGGGDSSSGNCSCCYKILERIKCISALLRCSWLL